ncbi:class I SAM-dependent methyltransferase [Burkholderia multivorans]|uniref:class I SAM-dependent methyltransferase n=1 Tax=Burkholderia multivorans TaxID=87883 RepID=UPI0021D83FE9|nr:class I SAM-dependent methyltransferase [Burkholderia multivorans]UXZ62698.1 class I SAM-dependent methyltransferase [Burkholderia multivorans]
MDMITAGTRFDSPFISAETISEAKRRVEEEGRRLGVGGGGLHFDTRRFAVTVEYMKTYGLHEGYCVEIGSLEYLSSKVIWSFFPRSTVSGTNTDLRYHPLPFADASVDNILCTEVIEHISDIVYREATTLSGIFFFLDEIYRVLRVGGRALITTPNAASLWAIQRAMMKQAPLMYDWHFREFTKSEMQQIVEYAGFDIVAHNTEFVWHLWDFSPIERFIANSNYDMLDRGDDQFLVIEKPASRVRKPHNLNLPSKKIWKEEGLRRVRNQCLRNLYKLKLKINMMKRKLIAHH